MTSRRGLGAVAFTALLFASCSPSAPPSGTGVAGSPTNAAKPSASASAAASSPARPSQGPADAALDVVVDGLGTPVGLAPVPGSSAVVVWEQTGVVWLLADGAIRPEPFLDIRDQVVPLHEDYDERGLLGLAFDPDFASTRLVYVYYGAPPRAGAVAGMDHTNRLSSFRVPDRSPIAADPESEREVLAFEQPQFNHSGGGLGFGPDGRLYLGTGDGGGEGDASAGHSPQGNAQDPEKLNGKVLRIDVRGSAPGKRAYAIPTDNPFAAGGGRPEIYAMGFRNPWRLSWEPAGEQRLLVSDVGFGRYEEIDAVVRGGNYGWRIREGRHCLDLAHPLQDLATCPATGGDAGPLIEPVVEYRHDEIGIAVVGGFVYRGDALPGLRGRYVFADFTRDWKGSIPTPRGTLMAAQPSTGAIWDWRPLRLRDGLVSRFITGIGEDAQGELYVLARAVLGPTGRTGQVLKLVPPTP